MITTFRRTAAAAAAALLVGGAGVLATTGPASAFDLTESSWDAGTNILLDASETDAAVSDGIYFTGGLCGSALTRALQTGVYFSDEAAMKCPSAVIACALDASRRGNALSGTRFYADGTYKCLVR